VLSSVVSAVGCRSSVMSLAVPVAVGSLSGVVVEVMVGARIGCRVGLGAEVQCWDAVWGGPVVVGTGALGDRGELCCGGPRAGR
jgi:hypothetical protein